VQNSQGGSASLDTVQHPSLGWTPFLVLLSVAAILSGLLLSEFISPAYVFGTMTLVVSIVSVTARWPYGALLTIMVASVMPRIGFGLGGWNARPEHYAVGLVSAAFLIRWLLGERPRIQWTKADYLLIAYVVWNYVSSALMSPDAKMTLRWALLNNLVILPYWLIRFLVTDERMLRLVFRAFLAIGIAESAYAVTCFASRLLLGSSFGVEVAQYSAGFGGVYGTQYEPNLLGSYSASIAMMLLVLYFLRNRKPLWIVVGTVVALAALLVSLSRAALVSFSLVSLVLLCLGLRRGLVRAGKLLPLGLALTLLLMPVAATGGRDLAERFAGLSGAAVEEDTEAMGRLAAWVAAAEDIVQHPLAGNGTASFQLLADTSQLPILGDRPWIANSLVRILNDTGIIGLSLVAGAAVAVARQVRKRIKRGAAGRDVIIALFAGCLVYAIAFMSTDGTMLAFFWVHVGLLTSACNLVAGARTADWGRRLAAADAV
jgi:O-antigen ligase